MADLPVRMECKFERKPDSFRLGYSLQNDSAGDVAALLWIPALQPDHTTKFTPDSAYVEWDAGALHIRKLMLAPPAGMQAAERPIPFLSIIKAKQKLMQVMTLAVPTPVHHPFRQAVLGRAHGGMDIVPAEPRIANLVTLSIGIFPVTSGMKVIPVQADLGIVRCWPFPTSQQILTWQTPLAPPLAVLDYRAVPRAIR